MKRSAARSSPPPCWIGCCTTPSSSRSTAQATACAATPTFSPNTSARPQTSRRRRPMHRSVAVGHPKMEAQCISQPENPHRQSGDFYSVIDTRW